MRGGLSLHNWLLINFISHLLTQAIQSVECSTPYILPCDKNVLNDPQRRQKVHIKGRTSVINCLQTFYITVLSGQNKALCLLGSFHVCYSLKPERTQGSKHVVAIIAGFSSSLLTAQSLHHPCRGREGKGEPRWWSQRLLYTQVADAACLGKCVIHHCPTLAESISRLYQCNS